MQDFSHYTLLFVDDEPMVLQSLSVLFGNYSICTASNGREALAVLATTPVDIIISDQRMPGMQGVELLKTVKERFPNTVRILMTGYSDLDAILDSVNTGEIFRYISKPWQSERLRSTVELACSLATRRSVLDGNGATVQNQPVAQPSPSPAPVELLFIDGKESHLQSFKEFFSPKYTVHTASSAAQAFRILREQPIIVASCDFTIGELDGADLLTALKAKYPHITTILMSDVRDAKLAVRMINEAQVFRYLVKPFPREALRSTVESAIARSQQFKADAQKMTISAPPPDDAKPLSEQLAFIREQLATKLTY